MMVFRRSMRKSIIIIADDDVTGIAMGLRRRVYHVVDRLVVGHGRSRILDVCFMSLILSTVTVAFSGLTPGSALAAFGVLPNSMETVAMEKDGTIDTRAGSHPYDYTVSFKFKTDAEGVEGSVRDLEADLPLGLIGNPLAIPRCSRKDFDKGYETFCPGNTQVGFLEAEVKGLPIKAPIFNLVPPPGVPARLGVQVIGLSAIEDAAVRTGSGYGVSVAAHNIPTPEIGSASETIWGVPYDKGHDPQRRCIGPNGEELDGLLAQQRSYL